jgi:hypothetical protein
VVERLPARGTAEGRYAHWDAQQGVLHLWLWRRSDWQPKRSDVLVKAVADEFAARLGERFSGGRDLDAAGWGHASATAVELPIAAERQPPGLEAVEALMHPIASAPAYLLVLHGLDAAAARAVLGDLPMRELAAEGDPPWSAWSFAAPPSPAMFALGPGPRWGYCLRKLGSGAVERARWAAYDAARHALFVWDWESPEGRPAALDVTQPAPAAAPGGISIPGR